MNKGLLTAWDNWEAALPPDQRAITRTAFRALVAGRTPSMAELGEALGEAVDGVARSLHQMITQGLATLDGDRITGIGGLSLVPAPHALQWNGRPYWTWCALDAIGIPAAIGGIATVQSHVAPGGVPVSLIFEDGAWRNPDPTLGIRLVEPEVARPLCGGT